MKRLTFIDENKKKHFIDEIVKTEIVPEKVKTPHGEFCITNVYYAVLKNGTRVEYRYHVYKKYLNDSQKLQKE